MFTSRLKVFGKGVNLVPIKMVRFLFSFTVLWVIPCSVLGQTKLLPSDGAEGDRFGTSVSINGDRIVVGAWADDDNGDGSGSAYVFFVPSTHVAVDDPHTSTPSRFVLEQNYPNPFNRVTTITYRLLSAQHVYLEIYDLFGRKVASFSRSGRGE